MWLSSTHWLGTQVPSVLWLHHPSGPGSPLSPARRSRKRASAQKGHTSLPLKILWREGVIWLHFHISTLGWGISGWTGIAQWHTVERGQWFCGGQRASPATSAQGSERFSHVIQELHHSQGVQQSLQFKKWPSPSSPLFSLMLIPKHWDKQVAFPDLAPRFRQLSYQNPVALISRGPFVLFLGRMEAKFLSWWAREECAQILPWMERGSQYGQKMGCLRRKRKGTIAQPERASWVCFCPTAPSNDINNHSDRFSICCRPGALSSFPFLIFSKIDLTSPFLQIKKLRPRVAKQLAIGDLASGWKRWDLRNLVPEHHLRPSLQLGALVDRAGR